MPNCSKQTAAQPPPTHMRTYTVECTVHCAQRLCWQEVCTPKTSMPICHTPEVQHSADAPVGFNTEARPCQNSHPLTLCYKHSLMYKPHLMQVTCKTPSSP